ncbi:MAG TPA: type II toxin-antitoxin system RelE/ParE family toxin [Candidatus Marinimicrobia bacterium]|nr:type II toxin-antitoxin system RelE/ParE family toxin [Candidatus Neomarinimicrobiota bacterium]
MYKVVYTKNAQKDLKKLELKNAQRIIKKISHYSRQKNPLGFAKPLKNILLGQYRFKIGNYRVIFDVGKNGKIRILFILSIKHRKRVYRI